MNLHESSPSTCTCLKCRERRNTQARARYHAQNPDAEKRGSQTLPPAHGTRSRYVRHKCRCEACREANREYAQHRYQERETVHRNLSRADDLEVLDRSLVARGKALEQSSRPDAAARLDEIIRLRTQIHRIDAARRKAVVTP